MSAIVPPAFEYAPALESAAAVSIRERYGLFIGGEWSAPASGEHFATLNPATEETLAQVGAANAADVDRAVRAARRGYEKYWRKLRPSERAKYIFRIARALTERSREFAILETLDGGKPIRESRDFDVPQAAATFFYHAGWADKLAWAVQGPERTRALGVVGAIVPWNFPLLIAAWKLAPALACGNTVVLKPAETTPLSALLLAEVCQEAELPPGVINVVTGDGRTGAALVEHPDLDKLTFTGSTEVGKAIRRETAGTKKRLTLELGGKSALIVYDDAPLDQAVEGIVNAIFFNQGQVCCAGSRLLVQEAVYGEVVERLRARIETLRLGDPLDKNTDVGAINSRRQRDRIAEMVQGGVEEGATLVQSSARIPERGFWFPPSFFVDVQPTYRIAREEIFGPVLSVMSFRTPDEAIDRANNLPYGLSAGVWTSNGQLGLYTAERLAAGVVWCNTFNQFDPSSPFGGYKESGFGREGGLAGLREYLDL
jgi:acyl-CoA reductase-like NAD-dependent aldehyde dehydrogenase